MRRYAHAIFGLALVGGVASGSLFWPLAAATAQVRAGQSRVIAYQPVLAHNDDAPARSGLKPEVEALIKASTAEYKNMKSYQHTAEFVVKSGREAVPEETVYTLAIERPNKFAFKSSDTNAAAAICDGKVFYNLRSNKQYMRSVAPASYKDLNIVDDVTFDPTATYLIALMVQGDVLADPVIKTGLMKAGAPVSITEDGKKYDTLVVEIAKGGPPTTFYFNAQTHLLYKAVTKNDAENIRVTEIIENVKINTPVAPAMFQYTPPKDALILTRVDRPVDGFHAHSRNVRL